MPKHTLELAAAAAAAAAAAKRRKAAQPPAQNVPNYYDIDHDYAEMLCAVPHGRRRH